MYPREQIRAIAQKTDLVSLVGVLLKKRGKTYSGLCPFPLLLFRKSFYQL